MTARPQMTFAIDVIPAHVRENVVDRLIKGQSSRDVAAYLLQQGHKISHNAVARYNKLVVQPAIKIGAKLQKIEQLESNAPTDLVSESRQVVDATKQALSASPVLSRVNWLWSEAEANVVDAKADGDIKNRSSAIMAANKTLENYAKATGDPNFSSVPQQGTGGTTVVVVMPTASDARMAAWQAKQVIDVEPVE